ncbi:MAG: low molecular weight protein tyrosine phosphatase family protein [Paracoccaceae bacterium]
MKKVLFICGKARSRSPTAAQIFADWSGLRTDFGGISNDADDALSTDQIDWADVIMVMERRHQTRLNDRFGRILAGKKVLVLDIRDRFSFMDRELIEELMDKAGPRLR